MPSGALDGANRRKARSPASLGRANPDPGQSAIRWRIRIAPEPGSAAEGVLGAAHREATGETLQSFMTAGYLDTRVHALYDQVPALCCGPKSRNIQAFDECVSVSSLKRITTAMALFVAQWCGVEPVEA